jgi:hypothetical protein
MRINVQTYDHLSEGERFLQEVANLVGDNLSRFGGRITQVDVLLIEGTDDATQKGCVIEAQLTDHEPIAVRAHAGTLTGAVEAGAEKMEHVIEESLEEPEGPAEFQH